MDDTTTTGSEAPMPGQDGSISAPIKLHWKQVDSLKQKCEALGINYWRALKRRSAGMPDDKVFSKDFVRSTRVGVPVTVFGKTYPNMEEAVRMLRPPAHTATIGRWLGGGMPPDDAFTRVPNPGYREGIIYLVFHMESEMGYIGLTVRDPARRFADHIDVAVAGLIKSEHSLHAAFRKYGAGAFTVTIIDRGTSLMDLGEKERLHIKAHGTLAPHGFNISPGGTTGGSTPKPRVHQGVHYASGRQLIEHVAVNKKISWAAAAKRVQTGRIDVKAPPKPGQGTCRTAAYKTWSGIVHCITNPASKSYQPGVSVLERWQQFENFLQDVGQPPQNGLSFARLDKAQGFFPDNCAWMTRSQAGQINAAYMKKAGTLVGYSRERREGRQ